ncbi:MAG: CBS domain-containing protein [Saccharolobus sp.]
MGIIREPVIIRPHDTLLHALKVMILEAVPKVIIADEKEIPLGILTQKDVLKFITTKIGKRSFDSVRVSEIMNKRFVTVKESVDYLEAAHLMIDNKLPMLVVVSQDDKTIGMIIKSDLAEFYSSQIRGLHKVGEYMSKNPITISNTDTISNALKIMVEKDLGRLLVIDKEERIVGIVTTTDMLYVAPFLREETNVKVEDLMNPNVFVVSENEDLSAAAKLMANRKVKGIAIVNQNGNPIGVITTTDVVRALTSDKVREYLLELKMYTTSF